MFSVNESVLTPPNTDTSNDVDPDGSGKLHTSSCLQGEGEERGGVGMCVALI